MTEPLDRRARSPERARHRSLIITLARSRLLERLARIIAVLVIVIGILLISWGLFGEVNSFAADYNQLAQIAGGGDAVFSSTVGVFQSQVLVLLGLEKPAPADTAALPLPDTGYMGPAATATPFLPGYGFIPMQVEVGGPPQHAPALPTTPAADKPSAQANTQEAPQPTVTPRPPAAPGWIAIPRIGLDAPVILSTAGTVEVNGKTFMQWAAPNMFAAGWQQGSALLGEPGNTVLNGHHNIDGKVFGQLYELNQGDLIEVSSGDRVFKYAVSQVMKLNERDAPLAQREDNARWIMPSTDERLTLVTCWPPITNTYRLIVVAVPIN